MRYPEWVGDRRYVVIRTTKVVAAFHVKEAAEGFVRDGGGRLVDTTGGSETTFDCERCHEDLALSEQSEIEATCNDCHENRLSGVL